MAEAAAGCDVSWRAAAKRRRARDGASLRAPWLWKLEPALSALPTAERADRLRAHVLTRRRAGRSEPDGDAQCARGGRGERGALRLHAELHLALLRDLQLHAIDV